MTFDGLRAPSSGTVSVDSTHLLTVSARRSLVIPANAEQAVVASRALLEATDPVAQYQALFAQVSQLSAADAQARLRVAAAVAFDPVRDSIGLRRVDEALGGHIFSNAAGAHPSARSTTIPAANVVAASSPASLLYINGIHTNPAAAMRTGVLLQQLAAEQLGWNFGPGGDRSFHLLYNENWSHAPHSGALKCLIGVAEKEWALDIPDILWVYSWYQDCLGNVDLIEALGQWVNAQWEFVLPIDDQAAAFARQIRDEINNGRGVVVVAHSQGNLMVQEALTELPASARPCVAITSLAPPTNEGWPGSLARHNSLFVHGQRTQDILLTLAYDLIGRSPDAELLATNISRGHDELLAVAEPSIPERLRSAIMAGLELLSDFLLHAVDRSYLNADATRAAISAQLSGYDRAIQERCTDSVRIEPRDRILGVDGTTLLTATVMNPLGDTLAASMLNWISHDPSRATVDGAGRVTARDTGTVWISAIYGGKARDSVQIHIQPRQGRVFVEISGGLGHTCARTAIGRAYCWGSNEFGQLGTVSSPHDRVTTPVPVAGQHTFVSISAGGIHTCALTDRGVAYCWGRDGNDLDSQIPAAVPGAPAFASLSSGRRHTCALTAAGAAYCWGQNDEGQLGNGTTRGTSTPTRVAGGHTFTQISAGQRLTCGLTPEGETWCWGYYLTNLYSEGAAFFRDSVPVSVSGNHSFTSISSGGLHGCALTPSGRAYCWGDISHGRGGNGYTDASAVPMPVAGDFVFESISVGLAHACGVDRSGQAYCWGSNGYGQLGDQSLTDRSTPIPTGGAQRWSFLHAGFFHTCALDSAGRAYCWGSNSHGELGNGSLVPTTLPGPVVDADPATR